ncbi:hypothetical protein RJ639_021783 [Escallonia herrerae]|uniref:PB1 domain-containing protein n=1 Tax=Escallonia herrerae TaxID=1293975 RepID=A0AA89AGV4_9ASTE|nr:hypothetical protein RJ639_021783 [Escallonia herrerae]
MGKQTGKNKKKQIGSKSGDSNVKHSKIAENSPKAYDKDMAVFISMSRELKEDGNKLFQKRDHEGAMLKYEKALKFLPRSHIDVSYLRSNMAACYMQMGLSEYPRAIHECNLALEVTPKYSKALLKRARCYEALNRLDLALRDVSTVLKMEPNNLMATEIADRVRTTIEKKGIKAKDVEVDLVPVPDYVKPPIELLKEKPRKKKSSKTEKKKSSKAEKVKDKTEEKKVEDKIAEKKDEQQIEEKKDENKTEEKKAEDKLVVEEKRSSVVQEEPKRTVKLVFGEDIRLAEVPIDCSIFQLREIIHDRFPSSKAVLVKYRDQEGDLVTITTNEELRWAEASGSLHNSVRLYVVEVNPDQDPFYEMFKGEDEANIIVENGVNENGNIQKDWMKLYSEAMEETATSEEAQDLFNTAADKFQEMAALALFNWGNVHMSSARKRVYFTEDASKESVLAQVKISYDWAQKEFLKAGGSYEEALKIKPDFYEGVLALGQQQFEQAKLSWYYAVSNNVDFETWPSTEVIQLYNSAEDNMEKGMQMWEEAEGQRLNYLSRPSKVKTVLQKMDLDGVIEDISADEVAEQAANMRSQIYLLWGTMLYERSIMEYKLGLPVWQECLEVSVEKFELAGASATDIAVMIKNHYSNDTALEGLGFNIDEIVQAWNEMYEAKRWQSGVPSFRLEPLLRRRVSKLYHALEHA